MPDTVYFDDEIKIIKVDSVGDVTPEEMMKSLQAVLGLAEETGCNKILVNTILQTSMPSVMNLHKFGAELSNKSLLMKYAVVVSKDTHTDNYFIETVSKNRGVNMMIFDSEKEASDWLKR